MIYTKLTFSSPSPKPHYFIGSKIRGILGYALKNEVCINPTFKCQDCFAQDKCIFYQMYEKQNTTHKYRLDFILDDKEFRFSIILFDNLINFADKISKTMFEVLSQEFKDIKLEVLKDELKIDTFSSIVKIEFLTPLRIKQNNKIAKNSIDLLPLLSSINKLYYDIDNKEYQKLNISTDYKIISSHLEYKKITRKSNRQKKLMDFGGLVGDMIVSNIDKKTYELLKLGELIGIGKNRVFGLGKIKVEDIN